MRRSQGRRSSNTAPVRNLAGSRPSASTSISSSQPVASSAQKRSSSIPRPSFTATGVKPLYGQKHEQSLALGTTPSRANGTSRLTAMTPQLGGMTPQSRANMSTNNKGKETRNLSDKNCVLDMAKNFAQFLTDTGYPEFVTHKEIQKIDKHAFIKYFNYVYGFIDETYQLAPRFNEDDLIKNVKEIGYCGTLAKSALVSIGALHSTSQIVGLLNWLADLVRMLHHESEDHDSVEKAELGIMIEGFNAWCEDQDYDLDERFRLLYMNKYQVDEAHLERLDRQIQSIVEEYKIIEKKHSVVDEIKVEVKGVERKIEELSSKEMTLFDQSKKLQSEENHLSERLHEIKGKIAFVQKEIAELHDAAKNCKVSAEEARRIKAQIAANKRDCIAEGEQREQISKLVEKREMQLANIASEHIKIDRELNVDLMDMGMTIDPHQDSKEALRNFLDSKTAAIADLESRCLAMTEKRERIFSTISQIKMELKHTELQKERLEGQLESVKKDRDEMERLLLAQLAELESLSAAPRSDPTEMRLRYELETLQQRFAEQKAQMSKQEKDLQMSMTQNAHQLRDEEAQIEKIEADALAYHSKLAFGFQQLLVAAEKGSVTQDMINNFLPEPDFNLSL